MKPVLYYHFLLLHIRSVRLREGVKFVQWRSGDASREMLVVIAVILFRLPTLLFGMHHRDDVSIRTCSTDEETSPGD